MNKIKSYFLFSREHRSGIFLLFGIIVFVQLSYFFLKNQLVSNENHTEDKAWLLVQNEIDSLKHIQATKKESSVAIPSGHWRTFRENSPRLTHTATSTVLPHRTTLRVEADQVEADQVEYRALYRNLP